MSNFNCFFFATPAPKVWFSIAVEALETRKRPFSVQWAVKWESLIVPGGKVKIPPKSATRHCSAATEITHFLQLPHNILL